MADGLTKRLDEAMQAQTEGEAAAHVAAIVEEMQRLTAEPLTAERLDAIARENIGYWAGYYSHETRERVEKVYACEHPFFGKIAEYGAPSPTIALEAGMIMAQAPTRALGIMRVREMMRTERERGR
jgi:hypothetical protein